MVYSTASRSGTGKSFPQHHMYNATRSSTYKNRFRADFVVQWNHKELGGPVSHDTVRLGNLSLADRSFLELKRVAFGGPLSNLPGWPAAETLPTWPTDGALGLATPWSTWQDEGPNALLDMLDRSVLVSPVFGLKLPPAHAQRGELFFGGTNPELYTGAFRSVPVQAFDKKKDRPRRFLHGLWDLTLDAVTLHAADAPAVRFPTPKGAALLTTWRTIILPDAVADLLEPHYPNATRVNMRWKQIPCSLRSALPRLSFELAGHTFTLDGFDYTEEIGEEEAGELEYGREQVQGEAPWCVVTASGGYLDGRVMLGTPFLRKFYARFDMAERTVGCTCASVAWEYGRLLTGEQSRS